MAVGIRWYGVRYKKTVSDRMLARMRAAAGETRDYLKEKVSKPYPPSGPPGGYPAMRTGKFRDSIAYRTFGNERRIQIISNVPYAGYLEYGTRYAAARPAFRIGLRVFKSSFKRALGLFSSGGVR